MADCREKRKGAEFLNQKSKGTRVFTVFMDFFLFVLGSLIFAVSVNTFTAPNNIAPGGMTGIATMVNYLTDLPIGVGILVLNLPLFIWGFFEMGWKFIGKTIAATVMSSVAIDLTAGFLPVYQGDMLLTTVFGGLLSGLGLGLIFIRGGTTGGTDLAATLIQQHARHLSMGKLLLAIDLCIVVVSAVVYQSFESPLYAVIVIYITTKVIDSMLYGTNRGTGKMMFIISPKSGEISAKIMTVMDRGVTMLKSRGGYSGREGEVMLCAVRRQEVYQTYDIVYSIDPDAFIIVGDAGEISGEGFRQHSQLVKREKKKREKKK